jgi:oxygen-independent coproporphyrinogen-3 oxidase
VKSLYFHFPYCIHKCSYCDFYSIAKRVASDDFIKAVLKEIEIYTRDGKPEIDSIFFGGGTPSLLSAEQFTLITDNIFDSFVIKDNYEFTVECNPGAVDIQNISVFKEKGVNRISMGVQSFNENELKFLERIHSPEEAVSSYYKIREAGIENISIDMIYAIPGQTHITLNETLDKAIELNPEHISAYSLIYEEGTPMYERLKDKNFEPIPDDIDSEFYELIVKKLSEAGYEQYEVSNFSKQGRVCRHNLKYWHSNEYYGLGPSAHGFLNKKRYWNVRSINNYIRLLNKNKLPVAGSEILRNKDIMYERIFLTLRADGLNINDFENEFKINKKQFKNKISEYESAGFLKTENDKIKLTSKGYFIGDEISLKLIEILDK